MSRGVFSNKKCYPTNQNTTQKSLTSTSNRHSVKQCRDLSWYPGNSNRPISSQGNLKQNTLKRYKDSTIDNYFKCKRSCFDETKNKQAKTTSIDSTSSDEDDTTCFSVIGTARNNKINKIDFTNGRKSNFSNNTTQNDKTDFNDDLLAYFKSEEDNEFITSSHYNGGSIHQNHNIGFNKNIELPPINAQHGMNYQKLLEDDLDFFESLTESKDDKFIDLLCSINRDCEQVRSTQVKNDLPLDLFLQNFNSNHKSHPVLCQKCGSEVSSNNSQKEYKFKYVREINQNINTIASKNEYQKIHSNNISQNNVRSDLNFNRIKDQYEHSVLQTFAISNDSQINAENDFICLKSLAENHLAFPHHSISTLNTANLTQMKRTQSSNTADSNTEKTENEISSFHKRNSLLSTHSSSIFTTQETPNSLEQIKKASPMLNDYDKTEISSLEVVNQIELNKFEAEEKMNLVVVQNSSARTVENITEANPNKSMPAQFLTKFDASLSNNINLDEQETEKNLKTEKIHILQNVVLDNALINYGRNILASNNSIQTLESRALKDINSNILIKDIPKEKNAILSNNNLERTHILAKKRMEDVLCDSKVSCKDQKEYDYQNDINNIKEFLAEKIQDIGQYLLKNQNQENSSDAGNNLTNLILNNLNHPDDEILLKNLESQDIFSQPVIFVPSLVNRASLKSVQSSNENNKKTALPSGEMLVTAIDSFSKDDTLIAKGNYDVSIPDNIKKLFILRKISDIFMKLLNDIEDGYIPTLSAVDQTKWGNCTFDEHKLMLKLVETPQKKYTSLKSGKTRSKFKLTIILMGKIVALVINNSTCTKRELYYQLKNFVKFQYEINTTVDLISCIIDEPPWDFGVLATQKGLVYGDLKIILSENEIINCNIPGGSLIPQDQRNITKLESEASFILIVEKDSVFQKLLDEDLPNRLPRTFIMTTAKGYLDISTRLFVKKLWQILKIPVFAFVDADPCGIEIMLTYRFGSLALCHLSRYLALPSLRWIGVHPSEIISLNIVREPLTTRDQNKIRSLLNRPYIHSVPKIKEELELMLRRDFKAQIEGVMKSENYIRNFYIPSKLCAQDFI